MINYEELASILNERMKERKGGSNLRLARMLGMLTRDKDNPIQVNYPSKDRSMFSAKRYEFMLDAPFEISNKCCNVMKKTPLHRYTRATGRYPITGQMASESKLRTQKWLEHGCNAYDNVHPISNPMSFWTDQDVLRYIVVNHLKIASVYGEIVPDMPEECDGQISIYDLGLMPDDRKLKTTGVERTGCAYCGFGLHLEKNPNRLERMKVSHPALYDFIMKPTQKGGLGYKDIIDWINNNGDFDIKY